MNGLELIQYCYDEHIKGIGGNITFSFEEYKNFWLNHRIGAEYELKNINKSIEKCLIAYYPLPYYKDLRALIEIHKNGGIDFRDVPVRFLKQINND